MTITNPFTILQSPFTRRALRPIRRAVRCESVRRRWVAAVVFVTFLPNMTGLASLLSVRAAMSNDEGPAIEHSRGLTGQEMQLIAGTVTVVQPAHITGKASPDWVEEVPEAGGTKPADAGVGIGCGTCGGGGGTSGGVSMKTKNGNFSKTIVSIPALGMPLAFTVFQNSIDSYYSSAGRAWNHTYNLWLQEMNEDGDPVVLQEADRTQHYWNKNADGTYTGEAGLFDTLVKETNGEFTLTRAGGRERLHFSESGTIRRIWRWEDRHSKGLNFTYSSGGNLTTITDEVSRTITLAYDSSNRITTITDPASHSASLTFDSSGRLSTVTDLGGYTTTYAYNTNNDITSITDPASNVTTYTYTDNVLTGVTLPGRSGSQSVVTGTDGSGFPYTEFKNELNQATRYTYNKDGAGNPTTLKKVTDPGGYEETYTWDSNFNMLTRVDKGGSTWTYTYDSRGNRLTETGPTWSSMTPVTTWTYGSGESRDMVLTVTDPGGHVSTNVYNSSGDLTSVTNHLSQATSYTMNSLGLVTTVTDSGTHATTIEYDSGGTITKGYVTKITPPGGDYQQFAYNSLGDRTSVTIKDTASGTLVTSYSYDNLHRVTQVTFPLEAGEGTAANIQTTYNCCHPTVVTDELGIKTQTNYRADGLVSSVVENYQATPTRTTSFTYDGAGRRLTIVDGASHTTTYAYNSRGLVTSITHPDPATGSSGSGSDVESYAYTAEGQVSERQMADGTSEEQITAYTYQAWGLLTGVNYPTGTDPTFSYNIDGLRTSVTDGAGTQNWTYDALHRALTHEQPVASGTKTVSYTYNSDGQRSQMTLSGLSGAWTYTYNSDHAMTGVTNPYSKSWAWAYFGNGWLQTQTNANSSTAAYTQFNRGATKSIYHKKSDASNLLLLDYTRDKSMDITQWTEGDYTVSPSTSSTVDYAYDSFHQLTSQVRTGRFPLSQLTYGYDGAGNRSTYGGGSWTNNGANQLTNAANVSRTFSYDRKGNMATEVVSGTTTSFAYDFEQRLITETTGANVTNFLFDFDGTRRKTDGYGEFNQWYVFDGDSLLAEVDSAAGTNRRVYTSGATGQLSEHTLTGGGADYNYHTDARGDVLYYDDSSEALVQRYAYHAWGGITGNGGGSQSPRLSTVGAQNYYRHVAPVSSEYSFALGVRYYNSFLGRFLQRDPSGMVDGPNIFVYVGSNPVTRTDPSGRETVKPSGAQAVLTAGAPSAVPPGVPSALGCNVYVPCCNAGVQSACNYYVTCVNAPYTPRAQCIRDCLASRWNGVKCDYQWGSFWTHLYCYLVC